MKFLRQLFASCVLLGALAGATGAVAADAAPAATKAPAKDLVLKGDAKCTSCHDESDEPKLLHIGKTKHGTVADGRAPSCTNCHGESDLHTNNPAKLKERPPTDRSFAKSSKTPVAARNESCISCHRKDSKRSHWEGSAHERADVACTSCHQLHTAKDKVADKRGTRAVAQAYLEFLYGPEGQNIAGENYYRPIEPAAAAKFARQFPKVNLFTIDEVFGGWAKAQKTHFADGGTFDQIYTRK